MAGEAQLLGRLRAGDEQAFRGLVERHDHAMRRLARSFVPSDAVADEVVQETWLAVIQGLDGFAGRSSLKTWMFRILVNRAQSRGVRERRTTPFSSLTPTEPQEGPTVDPDRFLAPGHPVAGYWALNPNRFFELPEERLQARETMGVVAAAIARLPARHQQVIGLRDVEGWGAEEVCQSLGISAANQRVLLHRARGAVRAQLEEYFAAEVVEA
ncbi:MAG: RNA polymerase sigma factor [Solirubrobacteraceae bacterium]